MPGEYGLYEGLARPGQYDQRINDLYNQYQLKEQAKQRAENRARLFAEDASYNNALNAYDHALIKDYSQNKIKELGAWMRNNPGWQYSPDKYVQYKQFVNDLKDNDLLHKGLRVDSHIKNFEQYMADPKNAAMRDRPEIQQYKNQLTNYIKSGSVDGVSGNGKEFQFIPPEQLVDTTPVLMKYAKAVRQAGVDYKYLAPGVKSQHQFVMDADKKAAAEAAANDQEISHYLDTEYNKSGAKEKGVSKTQYILSKMNPYFESDKYSHFNYQTGGAGGASAHAGAGQGGFRDYYSELYNRARKAPTIEIQAGANGIREALVGKNNNVNTNGSFIKTAKGDFIPFNGGIVPEGNFSTSNSRFIYHPHAGGLGSYTVVMPKDALEQILGEQVFDEPTFGLSSIFGDTNIEPKYKNYGIQLIKGGKDGKETLAQIDLWKPFEGQNTSTHAAYNHGMGTKPEEVSSDINPNSNVVTGPDGVQWTRGNDGLIYGSNGVVVDANGRRIK